MKIRRYQTTLTAALILVGALLLAGSAAADPVGMQQLGAGYSAKLASGFLASSERSKIKETWTLTPQLRRGNDYMHQRYYSPILGRFISVDPVMGDTGSLQSYNRYSYVENNPVKLVDPDGREGIGALVGFAGGAVKAAIENIKIATQRPVSNKELFQSLIAKLFGGTLTGATAGLGFGVVGGAAMGGIGGGRGGAFKRGIDPASMNTKAMDREALKADVLGGAAGGALGGLAKGGSQLAQAGKVEAANIEAMAARAAAAEDRTLVALAHEANKNAAVVAQQTVDNAETIGAVAGTMIAEGVAKKISKSQAEKETN